MQLFIYEKNIGTDADIWLFIIIILKVEVIIKIMKVENKLLFYIYCPLMSVNDLYWPGFKCHITIHLQRVDLNIILLLVFQHIVCPRIKVR